MRFDEDRILLGDGRGCGSGRRSGPPDGAIGSGDQACARVFELTGGQPWLVNALARQLVEVVVPAPRYRRRAADPAPRYPSRLPRRALAREAETYLERAPYSEAAAQLVFMAFLHKITNGNGGYVDREYAAGRGRVDLCIRWPLPSGQIERWALELEVWRDSTRVDPVRKGCEQLAGYLARLGLDEGTLIVFDGRSDATPLPDRCSEEEVVEKGRRITVLKL
ncbi:MAG: hypothetical protein GY856_49950 [bacterium]|nr:hypothetical protein [bacterium]